MIPQDWARDAKLAALDKIGSERLNYELKDWQRSGAARLLSGEDVLLLVATGAGKSLLFYLYALARPQELIIVVSPLKMLEKDMVSRHHRA
jgi:superfamily II DNA helicase RecQ